MLSVAASLPENKGRMEEPPRMLRRTTTTSLSSSTPKVMSS